MNIWDKIYRDDTWNGGSGPGSDPEACKPYLEVLNKITRWHIGGVILDIGCGDGRLAEAMLLQKDQIYLGFDPSEIAIGMAIGRRAEHRFFTAQMPTIAADVVILKDVLQHLPDDEVHQMLGAAIDRTKIGGALLITNDKLTGPRPQIRPGGYAPINVLAKPFHLGGDVVLEWQCGPFVKQAVLVGL